MRILIDATAQGSGLKVFGLTLLERMRTFISRRNINLLLFLIGWMLGVVERLVQFWSPPKAVRAA